MPKITIKNLLGGITENYTTLGFTTGVVEGNYDQYTKSVAITTLKRGFKGHIAPAETFDTNFTDTGSEINSLVRASVTDLGASSGVQTFMITGGLSGTAPKIILEESGAIQAGEDITADAGDNFTTLPNLGYWGDDICIYKPGTGVNRSVLFSWNDSDDADIGTVALGAGAATIGTIDPDWMSSSASGGAKMTKGVPHKFTEGADNILYVTNGQYISSLDGNTGANGTWNATALNLGTGWLALGIRRYGKYLAILCTKTTLTQAFNYENQNKVILWDGTGPFFQSEHHIDDNSVTAIFVADQRLFAFSKGKSGTTKVWELLGEKFSIKAQVLTSLIGEPPIHSCIEFFNNSIYWVSGANVIAYGPFDYQRPGIHIPAVNANSTNDSSTAGFLKNVEQATLRISGLYSSTYALKGLSAGNYYANASTPASINTVLLDLGYKTTLRKVVIYFSQFESSSSIGVSMFKNYATLSVGGAADLLNKTVTLSAYPETANKVVTLPITNGIDASTAMLQIRFTHASATDNAAIIRKIEVYFDTPEKY